MNARSVAPKIMEYLILHGMTQKELCRKADVNEATMSWIMSGTRGCSLNTARKLAAVMGITIDELVNHRDCQHVRLIRDVDDVNDYRCEGCNARFAAFRGEE